MHESYLIGQSGANRPTLHPGVTRQDFGFDVVLAATERVYRGMCYSGGSKLHKLFIATLPAPNPCSNCSLSKLNKSLNVFCHP